MPFSLNEPLETMALSIGTLLILSYRYTVVPSFGALTPDTQYRVFWSEHATVPMMTKTSETIKDFFILLEIMLILLKGHGNCKRHGNRYTVCVDGRLPLWGGWNGLNCRNIQIFPQAADQSNITDCAVSIYCKLYECVALRTTLGKMLIIVYHGIYPSRELIDFASVETRQTSKVSISYKYLSRICNLSLVGRLFIRRIVCLLRDSSGGLSWITGEYPLP